mmetsp:Transcript_33/g.50  ORF Transcript_33/g.50 Transcript_33/m.50 type:complete len:398 (+) Transcript_33:87-1280(+)
MRVNRPPASEDDVEQVSIFEDEPEDTDFSVDNPVIIYTMKPLETSSPKRDTDGEEDVEQETKYHHGGDDTASQLTEDTFDLDVIKLASVDEVANMALLKERKKRRLPLVCRIGYIFLFHMVLLSFLTAATKAIYQQQQQQQNSDDAAASGESNSTASDEGTLQAFIHSLSDPASFVDATSPQSRAFEWIQSNNPDYIIDDNAPNHPILVQQYVLALLYFGLNGDNWRRNDRWLWNDASVCEWYTAHPYRHGQQYSYQHEEELSLCNDNGLLQILDLSGNDLEGTLPTELGHLSNQLTRIKLHRNHITGLIPTELSQLTQLEYLGLEENDLVGEIPGALGELQSLTGLVLFGNRLEGKIPDQLCDLQEETTFTYESQITIMVDCGTGTVTCDCSCECF